VYPLPQPRCRPPRDLVRPSRVDPAGVDGPTPKQARGPRWRRVGHGWYVPAGARRTPEQRALEASVRLPPGGAVTGWAACRLHGAAYLDGVDAGAELPVALALGTRGNLRPRPGIHLLHEHLPAVDRTVVAGIPCTSPERATYDAIRLAPDLRRAVRVADMAFAGEITSMSRMTAVLEGRARVAPQVRAALALASERSLSPPEADTRLVWELDAGLPRPLVNWPVLDASGRLLGVPDLFDPLSGVAVEYDGADHRTSRRHARDVDRESDLRDAGCELVRVVGPNLRARGRLVDRFIAARARGLARPADERRWKLGDPGPSLEERIAEREAPEQEPPWWLEAPFGSGPA
jgi:hypothetical protein